MTSVSHSEVNTFLQCRRQHFYGYSMSLAPRTSSRALGRGSAGHKVLDAFYAAILEIGGNSLEGQRAAFDEALEEAEIVFDELVSKGETGDDDKHATLEEMLFTWYFPHEPYVRNGWRILASELEFNLEYEEGTTFPGAIDLIARNPEGQTIVIDHKFMYDFISFREAQLLPQLPKYIGALRALGHKVHAGQYNQIRTRKQKVMTADKQLAQLPLPLSNKRIQQTFTEQIEAAADIQSRKALPLEEQSDMAWRTASKVVCQHCPFFDICTGELAGNDVTFLIQTEFKTRERREFLEISEEVG